MENDQRIQSFYDSAVSAKRCVEEMVIEYTKAKNKYCGEMEEKSREEKEKCTKLEIDLKAASADLEDKAATISKLEEENKQLENGIEEEKKQHKENMMELWIRIGDLERQKRQLEMDLKARTDKEAKNTEMEEKKYDQLLKKTCLLEKEICRVKKDKLDQDLLEAEKKRVAEMEGVVLGLWKKIESLERAKKNKHAKDAEIIHEKGTMILNILHEKRLVELKMRVWEEKVVALTNQIKTLMEEKMDKDKMMSEREEAIKVLDRENVALEAQKKELEIELKTVKLSLVLKTEK